CSGPSVALSPAAPTCPTWNSRTSSTVTCKRFSSHSFDDGGAELGGGYLGGTFHQAGEVVGDDLLADGRLQAPDDQFGDLVPAHVAEHHLAGEDDRTGVDLVLAGIFGGGAVGGLEDGEAGLVVDVASGGDADASHLSGEGVG